MGRGSSSASSKGFLASLLADKHNIQAARRRRAPAPHKAAQSTEPVLARLSGSLLIYQPAVGTHKLVFPSPTSSPHHTHSHRTTLPTHSSSSTIVTPSSHKLGRLLSILSFIVFGQSLALPASETWQRKPNPDRVHAPAAAYARPNLLQPSLRRPSDSKPPAVAYEPTYRAAFQQRVYASSS